AEQHRADETKGGAATPTKLKAPASLGHLCIQFIESRCRLTRGSRKGQLVRLLPCQNGKTFLFACISLFMALMGEDGGEVYFVAGDRQQASRAFDEVRRIVE